MEGGYYGEGGLKKYFEMSVPIVIIILIVLIVAVKLFNQCWIPVLGDILCDTGGMHVIIICDYVETPDVKRFENEITHRTRIKADISPPTWVSEAYLTGSKQPDLVIIYGDKTRLTDQNREELAAYISGGGGVMIVGEAGITDPDDPHIFSWKVDDMAPMIKFEPDCEYLDQCRAGVSIGAGIPPSGSGLRLVPGGADWHHPVIERSGGFPYDMAALGKIPGKVTTVEPHLPPTAWFEWQTDGKIHSTPAIIIYAPGVTGGRLTYLAYDPTKVEQRTLMENLMDYTAGVI